MHLTRFLVVSHFTNRKNRPACYALFKFFINLNILRSDTSLKRSDINPSSSEAS